MRHWHFIWLLLFCSIALSSRAQTYQPRRITFSGYDGASYEELLAVSGLKKGVPLGSKEMNAAAQRLNDTGLFANLKFKFDGEELHFDLLPEPAIFPAHFDNFPWWGVGELVQQLHARLPVFHGSLAWRSGLQQQVSDALTAMLAERHISASIEVTPQVDRATGKTQGMLFHIGSPSIVLGSIFFNGTSPANAPGMDAIAKAATGQNYDLDSTPKILSTAILGFYRNKGFLEAAEDSTFQAPALQGDRVVVPVGINVKEGEQYRLGSLVLDGDIFVTQDEFLKHALLHPSEIASEEKLRQTMAYVVAPYRSKGYLRCKIAAHPTLNSERKTVDYTISVTPGDVFHMGTVKVENLTEEQKNAFLHVWKLKPGDVFDASYIWQALKQNKSLHVLDGYSASYKQYENEQTHIVDVVYTFRKGGPIS